MLDSVASSTALACVTYVTNSSVQLYAPTVRGSKGKACRWSISTDERFPGARVFPEEADGAPSDRRNLPGLRNAIDLPATLGTAPVA